MKNVPLATFNELEPAQKLTHRLQQSGVSATIHDESRIERFWFISRPLAAVHVQVPHADYLKARSIIETWDAAEGLMTGAVCCPECHSSRVEFPQVSRKFATPALTRLFISLGMFEAEHYCLDCQFTWPAEPPRRREFDILGFPMDSNFWHPRRP